MMTGGMHLEIGRRSGRMPEVLQKIRNLIEMMERIIQGIEGLEGMMIGMIQEVEGLIVMT